MRRERTPRRAAERRRRARSGHQRITRQTDVIWSFADRPRFDPSLISVFTSAPVLSKGNVFYSLFSPPVGLFLVILADPLPLPVDEPLTSTFAVLN